MEAATTLARAIAATRPRPRPSELVAALQALEKQARAEKPQRDLTDLQGRWQLRFISGGARSRGGIYVPGWLRVEISYAPADIPNTGRVENAVQCGPLKLTVTGPIALRSPRGLLAFDFTQISLGAFSRNLYQGELRGGPESEKNFAQQPMSELAFFSYFWIKPDSIAARGRGGGLALWKRVH